MSIVINNIGTIYDDQGDIAKALDYYHKGLNLYEEMGNKKGMALALNNIGYIYYNQADIKNALDYYNKSLKIRMEIGDKNGISNSYNNLGSVYKSLVNDSKYINKFELKDSLNNRAIEYFYKSLEIRKEIGDNQGVAITLNNMGLIYNNMSDDAYLQQNIKRRDSLLELSIEYCQKSLKIREESGYKQDMASSLYNLARFYKQQNQILKFKNFSERSYKISKELGFPEDIGNSASLMREIAVMNGDYKKAYEYYQEQMNMKDSVQNEQNYRQTQQQQARYTYQKQAAIDSIAHDKAIQIKNLELAKTEQEKEKQQIVIYSFVLGFAIILIFSILLLRLFLQKKKANQLLAKQNAEISQQKEEIESQRDEIESQRDQVMGQKEQIEELYEIAVERKNIVEAQQVEIHDSIRYAKRIQHAVLPDFSRLFTIVENNKQFSVSSNQNSNNTLPISKNRLLNTDIQLPIADYFVLFKPKDIVSGDFYWATKTEDWTIITVADCTGHGVPGAFMSMLGVSFLNEIVRRKEVTDAAMVLNQLRSAIIDALGQTGEEGTQKDGMDMSIIAIRNQPQSSKLQDKESNQYSVSSKQSADERSQNNNLNELQTTTELASSTKLNNKQSYHAQWAGANNPLWIVRSDETLTGFQTLSEFRKDASANNEQQTTTELASSTKLNHKLFEFKPDKMPVAVHLIMDNFTNHEIQLETGDCIYLMSDGYQDQFGGTNGKKFLSKNLKQLLIDNCQLPMDEQKQVLEKTLIEWIGDGEQIDDITVVGIKII